jgi:hypothetical protein
MVERLLLDGVHAEAARASIGIKLYAVAVAPTHETQPTLALVQPAVARAHVALHATVLEPPPVARRSGRKVGIHTIGAGETRA